MIVPEYMTSGNPTDELIPQKFIGKKGTSNPMLELATYILQKSDHAKHSKSSPESNPGPTKEEQVSTLKSKAQKRSMNQLHKKNAQGKGTLTI